MESHSRSGWGQYHRPLFCFYICLTSCFLLEIGGFKTQDQQANWIHFELILVSILHKLCRGGKEERKGKEGEKEGRKKGNPTYCKVSISIPQLKHFKCKILHVILVTDIQGTRKAEFSLIQLILRIPWKQIWWRKTCHQKRQGIKLDFLDLKR